MQPTAPRSHTTEEFLSELLVARPCRSWNLEFRLDLPIHGHDSEHQFLSDVSAFANARGGDLIFGADCDDSTNLSHIVSFPGNGSKERMRLEEMAAEGVEPRIPGLIVRSHKINNGFIIVVTVTRSWIGPHRVKSDRHFYLREDGQTRQLPIAEIRGLFLSVDKRNHDVRDFRAERLGKLLAMEGPCLLARGVKLVIHVVPTVAALGAVELDPATVVRQLRVPVLCEGDPTARINVDGALFVQTPEPEKALCYSLMLRNGFFEAVKVLPYDENGTAALDLLAFESNIDQLLQTLKPELIKSGLEGEHLCMVSIIDADRVTIQLPEATVLRSNGPRFDRKLVLIPEIVLRSADDLKKALRPLFDLVWQAAGEESRPIDSGH